MLKNMDSRSETQVKTDYARKAQEVPNLKGHEISQLAQNINSLHFLNPICLMKALEQYPEIFQFNYGTLFSVFPVWSRY